MNQLEKKLCGPICERRNVTDSHFHPTKAQKQQDSIFITWKILISSWITAFICDSVTLHFSDHEPRLMLSFSLVEFSVVWISFSFHLTFNAFYLNKFCWMIKKKKTKWMMYSFSFLFFVSIFHTQPIYNRFTVHRMYSLIELMKVEINFRLALKLSDLNKKTQNSAKRKEKE